MDLTLDMFDHSNEEENDWRENSRAAERRKNDWKHAKRRWEILNNTFGTGGYYPRRPEDWDKPLHYYSKNPPHNGYAEAPNKTNNKGSRRYISKNYASPRNWNEHDQRQIDDFENQLNELFDNE